MTVRNLTLFLTLLTGYAGLVYEVTWHRYLSNLIGSQAKAAAIILAVFLGGLSLGYTLFGKVSRRWHGGTLVKICGWIEVLIGVWCLIFPTLYDLVWSNVGILKESGQANLLAEISICVALIGFPTVMMGGTLPLLTQGLSRDIADAAPFHAAVYALNTAGAFLGSLVAGFVLLPLLGLPLSMMATAPINLIAGVVLVLIGTRIATESSVDSSQVSKDFTQSADLNFNPTFKLSLIKASTLAFLAGFYSLTLQVVLMRLVGLSMGTSEYAFSMVVAVFVSMLALGAWRTGRAASAASNALWRNQIRVSLGLIVIYLTVPYWPYGTHVIRTIFSDAAPSFYIYHLALFLILSFLLALPIGGMGATMPLLFSSVRENVGTLGSKVGVLYSWNTLGCIAGALFGGFLLLYFWNLDQVFQLCIVLSLISLALVTPLSADRLRLPLLVSLLAAVLPLLIITPWEKEYLAKGTYRSRSVTPLSYSGRDKFYARSKNSWLIAYRDDPNTSVSVRESVVPDGLWNVAPGALSRSIYVNGKSDGATSGEDLTTTRLLGHLPVMFQTSDSKRAAVIGFGTGITVGSLTLHPDIEKIDCIEIAPAIRNFAPLFDFANHNASSHAKVNWHIGDAYRVLGGSDEKYAAIISEPSNPWITGVERLYAREFYEIVQKRLAPGGVYAQWINMYAFSEEALGMVINTFTSYFPTIHIFRSFYDLIIIGSENALSDEALRKFIERFESAEIKPEFAGVGIDSIEKLLAREVLLTPAMFQGYGFHSLENPRLAFQAGQDFFSGKFAEVDQIANLKERRTELLKAYQSSVFERFAKLNPKADRSLFTRVACKRSELGFFPDWEKASYACQRGLIELAQSGKIPEAAGSAGQRLSQN